MKTSRRDLLTGLLVTLVVVGLLGAGVVLWATLNLFGTGCDPVLDPTLCTPEELSAWKEAVRNSPR